MARVRVMTNPMQLMMAGNPRRGKAKQAFKSVSKSGRVLGYKRLTAKQATRARAKGERLRKDKSPIFTLPALPSRSRTMSKRRKMTAKQAKYFGKRKAKRASRKARRASAPKRKKSRRGRKSKMKRARRVRHSRRARRHVRSVAVSPKGIVRVVKVRRGGVRRAKGLRRRKAFKTVGVNPGSLSLAGGLGGFAGNAKAVMRDGVMGFAKAALGAGGAIFAGTIVARVTTPLVAQFAPSIVASPWGSRILAGLNYYVSAWALAKYLPGVDGKTRRAMFTGGVAAAILEVARPGLVRDAASRLPVVGGLFGNTLEGMAGDLGAYVATALGSNTSDHVPGVYDPNPGAGSGIQPTAADDQALEDYVALNDYVTIR